MARGNVDLGLLFSKILQVISKSKGPLSSRISSAAIESANCEVCVALNKEQPGNMAHRG